MNTRMGAARRILVLVVDDENDSRTETEHMLVRAGYMTEGARDGREALESLGLRGVGSCTRPTGSPSPEVARDARVVEVVEAAAGDSGAGSAAAVSDGGPAVESARESIPRRVDLVLMDLVMPRTDGLEATREIRRRLTGQDSDRLPIIGWSSRDDEHARAGALAAGMDDLVRRHSDVERLAELVNFWTDG